ncbi:MAG: glycosyltransferase, partial [Cyanobacteria bacterium J06649_11]
WEFETVIQLGWVKPQLVFRLTLNCLYSIFPNRKDNSSIKLGFFGRVGLRKGTFDLIKAFAKMPSDLQNRCELIIAGDGDIEEARKLVESYNLTNCVQFLGWIDSQTRDKLLANIDVFILPSYNEGLPMALLEAMGWGLPVIVTPVGGIPELIISTENGLLVTPGNIQQLSQAMQELIQSQSLRVSLGNAARETVTPFDIKTYCSQLHKIYNSVLESKSKNTLSPATAGQ